MGLCMDAVRMLPKIDVLVLVSGDGDFSDLLDFAKSQGVRTEVIAFGKELLKCQIDPVIISFAFIIQITPREPVVLVEDRIDTCIGILDRDII